ncbi:MAG: hypothetical protein AB1345_08015 [Chloroflexota bacterium]
MFEHSIYNIVSEHQRYLLQMMCNEHSIKPAPKNTSKWQGQMYIKVGDVLINAGHKLKQRAETTTKYSNMMPLDTVR